MSGRHVPINKDTPTEVMLEMIEWQRQELSK